MLDIETMLKLPNTLLLFKRISESPIPMYRAECLHTSGGFILRTFVILPCMMRKCGLLTLSCTDLNRSWTLVLLALLPLIKYLFLPPITTFSKIKTHTHINAYQFFSVISLTLSIDKIYKNSVFISL